MTMYNSKLAAAIKVAGKILREEKENVFLPFGSEFTIFLKNLNSKRAVVKVEIDGKPVDGGLGGFVIDANSTLELERFIRNGNLNEGNKFKFIQRNAAVEAGRGIGCEDGIVRIEFQYETPEPAYVPPITYYRSFVDNSWQSGVLRSQSFNCSSLNTFGVKADTVTLASSVGPVGSIGPGAAMGGVVGTAYASASASPSPSVEPMNYNGITVEGSVSTQKFQGTFVRPLEPEKFVMVFKLMGDLAAGAPVKVAETKKTRKTCKTCKHRNAAGAKFCAQCGTALNII